MQTEISFGTNDKGNRERVLALLSDLHWHDTLELQRVGGIRAPARVHELRGRGWDIRCEGHEGRFKYRLFGRLAEPPKRRSWKQRALDAESRVRELEQLLGGDTSELHRV